MLYKKTGGVNMEYVYIGKIVSTHGIKGEVKIISDFEYKEKVFKKGVNIYIGPGYCHEVINTYRHHKQYDMISFSGYNNINEVLKYMKKNVYIDKSEINFGSDILICDIIGMKAYVMDKFIGCVNSIYNTGVNYKVVEIMNEGKKTLIPYHKDFIKNIDKSNNTITFTREG